MATKRNILAALTVVLVMTFASSVLAQPITQYQGQNHQEGHQEGHEGHHGHMRH
ncbi:MAG TPA: hypothetical protein V6D26_13675 [Stenomitos sp.]